MNRKKASTSGKHELLSTGIPALDIELEGGLSPGSLVYLISDSMAMTEIFLYHFIQLRPTYYVNTERKPEFIERNLERLGFETSDLRFIDIHQKYYEKEVKLLDYGNETKDYKIVTSMKNQLEEIDDPGINLIVDTISFFLNRDVKISVKRELLDIIYSTSKRIDGLAFLYGLKGSSSNLIENDLFNLCDVVFDASIVKKGDKTTTELTVPKARDRPIRGNILKFKIERGIIMDTSREIA